MVALLIVLGACATPKDYSLFKTLKPRSILVLPPINNSKDVRGTYGFLPSTSPAIAEQGFYVYPVALVDRLMKENGLPGPAEMHGVSLKKIDEIFGADAVMYITIQNYGSSFQVVDSVASVVAEASLVHVKSGQKMWDGKVHVRQSSTGGSQSGLLGLLVESAIAQTVNHLSDVGRDLSPTANATLFGTVGQGLPWGPMHEKYGVENNE